MLAILMMLPEPCDYHYGHNMLSPQKDVTDIHRHDLIETGSGYINDVDHGSIDAGVVDQTINAPEPLHGERDHRFGIGIYLYIARTKLTPRRRSNALPSASRRAATITLDPPR